MVFPSCPPKLPFPALAPRRKRIIDSPIRRTSPGAIPSLFEDVALHSPPPLYALPLTVALVHLGIADNHRIPPFEVILTIYGRLPPLDMTSSYACCLSPSSSPPQTFFPFPRMPPIISSRAALIHIVFVFHEWVPTPLFLVRSLLTNSLRVCLFNLAFHFPSAPPVLSRALSFFPFLPRQFPSRRLFPIRTVPTTCISDERSAPLARAVPRAAPPTPLDQQTSSSPHSHVIFSSVGAFSTTLRSAKALGFSCFPLFHPAYLLL